MDWLKQVYEHIKNFIRDMTGSQMVLAVAFVAALIVTVLLLVGVFKSVTYVTLYKDLDGATVSEVIDELDQMGIPHQITDGGSTIEVPSGDVYKARIRLASQGLPKSGTVGYSIFDKTNLGMTEFLQKMNFRRALEGELAKSVMELSAVEAARVHVVIPEEHLFEEDQELPTASVLVKLASGGVLTPRQIKGVTHLIASSVEGLTPENISIVDYNGNLLTSQSGSDPLAALSSTQLELRKSVEKYLENKAQSFLDQSMGKGKSIVRVTAELDFDQVEKTKETFDPDNLAIRSEERIEEGSSEATASSLDSSEANASGTKEQVIVNYEVNRTVEHIVNSVGNIKKLTVAVMVDGHYNEIEGDDGATTLEYMSRDSNEVQQITALVKNAVGFSTDRSDEIEVVNLQFDTTDITKEQERLDEIATRSFYIDVGKKVLFVIAAIFIFLYAKKKIRRAFVALSKYVPPLPPPPEPPQAPPPPPEPPIEVKPQKARMVDQLKKTAEEKPDEMAKVIKTLMTD